jgi:hypothetical protein
MRRKYTEKPPGSKQLKLKKRVVYTYEYDDKSDDEKPSSLPTTNILFKKPRPQEVHIPAFAMRSRSHNRDIGSSSVMGSAYR